MISLIFIAVPPFGSVKNKLRRMLQIFRLWRSGCQPIRSREFIAWMESYLCNKYIPSREFIKLNRITSGRLFTGIDPLPVS
jgi:hypothetical protein